METSICELLFKLYGGYSFRSFLLKKCLCVSDKHSIVGAFACSDVKDSQQMTSVTAVDHFSANIDLPA